MTTSTFKLRPLLLSIGMVAVFIALLMIISVGRSMLFGNAGSGLVYGVIGCFCGMTAIYMALRVDRLDFKSINLYWKRRTPWRFLSGLLISFVIFMLIVAVLCICCDMRLQFSPQINWRAIGLLSLALFFLALMEELGFRTFALVKLNKAYGIWIAQFVIAFLFAVYHILNGWGIALSFMGPFVWAFVFGLAALWSKGIAIPTGIHVGLNIMQNIAGFKKSDAVIFKLVYRLPATKAMDIWQQQVGYGIHAVILILALAATYWYSERRKSGAGCPK